MATRCFIFIEVQDAFKGIYCHHDGYYLNGVGETLTKYYNTLEQAINLIDLGDISVLKPKLPTVEDLNTYTFEDFPSDVTLPYSVRGETPINIEVYSEKQACSLMPVFAEFVYIFKDNAWYIYVKDEEEGYRLY